MKQVHPIQPRSKQPRDDEHRSHSPPTPTPTNSLFALSCLMPYCGMLTTVEPARAGSQYYSRTTRTMDEGEIGKACHGAKKKEVFPTAPMAGLSAVRNMTYRSRPRRRTHYRSSIASRNITALRPSSPHIHLQA